MGNERSGRGGIDTEQFDRLVRFRDSGRPSHEAARAVGCDRKTAQKVYEGTHIFQADGRLKVCPTCGKRVHKLPCQHCLARPVELEPIKLNPADLVEVDAEEGTRVRQLFARESTVGELLPELIASIGQLGVIQPPVVYREKSGWRVVLGGKRVLAAYERGLPTILCLDAQTIRQRQWDALLTDEFLRAERDPIERGRMFAAALEDPETGHSQKTLGALVGKSQAYVSAHVNLLKLPEAWRDLIIRRLITVEHARLLVPLAADKVLLGRIHEQFLREDGAKGDMSRTRFRELVQYQADQLQLDRARASRAGASSAEAAEEESPLDELIKPRKSLARRGPATREIKLKYTADQADLVEAMLDQVAERRGYESREETVEALAREALGQNGGDPEPHILQLPINGARRKAA